MVNLKTVNLINPPAIELYDPSAYPPLGLLYIGGALKREGFNCKLIDLSDQVTYTIPDADFHLISVLNATYKTALGVRNSIKSGMVVVGGIQATINPKQTFEDFHPDTLITGEAEDIIADVLNDKMHGIIDAGVIKDLNALALPDRDLVPITKLRNLYGLHLERCSDDGAATTLISSRGCPFKCEFCCKLPQTSYFRWRSPKNIIVEIQELQKKYNINHARFVDDCFTVNPKRVYELCDLLKGTGFYWSCLTRTDALNEKMLREMQLGGCREIQFGIESGSQKILDDMNKMTNVETNKRALQMVRNSGIHTKIFMIESYPTETEDDINLTKQFILDTQPDKVTVSTFLPLPGSVAYEKYGDDPRYKDRIFYNLETDSELKKWVKSETWRKI